MFHVKHKGVKMVKAVIFDFNGTLLDDGAIHKKIWNEVYPEISEKELSDEIKSKILGNMNSQLLKSLSDVMELNLNDEQIEHYSQYKEEKYRNYIHKHKYYQMVKGAEELFEYITFNNIEMAVCTASIQENVDHFFSTYRLNKWFLREDTVYDDGSYTNKADMYRDCAAKLGVAVEECIIFEDSKNGIDAAIAAGCKKIVKVDTVKDGYQPKEVVQVIEDFTQFDYQLFEK